MSNTTQVFLEYPRFWYSSTTFKSSTRVVTEVSMSIQNNIYFGKWFLINLLYNNLHITQLHVHSLQRDMLQCCGCRYITIMWVWVDFLNFMNTITRLLRPDMFASLPCDNFPSKFPCWVRRENATCRPKFICYLHENTGYMVYLQLWSESILAFNHTAVQSDTPAHTMYLRTCTTYHLLQLSVNMSIPKPAVIFLPFSGASSIGNRLFYFQTNRERKE